MTHFIPLSSILVAPDRQRRVFDEESLQDLVTSISETPYGLQHPIVVRQTPKGPLLVAGERRLRAISQVYDLGGHIRHAGSEVPSDLVPVVDLGELDPIDAYEAELEENIRRADLSMIEQAKATARLLELRSLQADRDGRPPPTTGDLTREIFDIPASVLSNALGGRRDHIKAQLMVARHAHLPEVAKAPTLKEAVKIIKRSEDNAANALLAEAAGKAYSSADLNLIHGNCITWLEQAAESQFDLIITDPPYGIGAHEFNDSGVGVAATAHFYEDSYDSWRTLMAVLPKYLFAATKSAAHTYLFCDIDRFHELRERMSEAGWTPFRTPLIWHNPDGFRAPWPQHGPQRKYECILFARKGDRSTNRLEGDVLTYRKDAAVGHPAQKPVDLLTDLLRRSARPGDRVLDPFAGSGSTLVACHEAKLACVGIEADAATYGMALKRIKILEDFGGLFG
jgi:site-specific DNA-methyltransferase (adenine-specific)